MFPCKWTFELGQPVDLLNPPPILPGELRSRQTLQPWEHHDLGPSTVQRALAAAPAVQIAIREAGWYRVTQPDLVATGLDPDVDPRRLQLFVEGRPQRMVVAGEQDRRFDPHDAIEFYGDGLDTPWTDTQIYWLVAGSQRGKRMRRVSSQSQAMAPASFPVTAEHRARTLYVAALKNGEAENFFGAVVATEPMAHALLLHHLAPSPPEDARLEVALQGITSGPHQAGLTLNGRHAGIMTFAGQTRQMATFLAPHAWLRDGENIVTLVPHGNETDVSVVDHIRLTYWHTYTADNDVLQCTVPAHRQVTIDGFRQSAIRVVDITHPRAVRELLGHVTPQEASDSVTVATSGLGPRTLLAFTEAQIKPPAAITANRPSTWHRPEQGADIVMIAPEIFHASIAPLQTLRETQGWTVALADVSDLYDELNFGAKSPWALKAFLHGAYTQWQQPPRFVLLIGDASFDPHNYLGFGDVDSVPTKLVDTVFFETASDD